MLFGLQAARLRAHLEHAEAGGVVDVQPHRAQRLERARNPRIVFLPDRPAHEAMAVELRLGREEAQEQRLLRHLQTEDAHRMLRLQCHVLGDIQHQACLAHRRPRRDDDQLARLKPARHRIEVDKPGWYAGDQPLLLEEQLDLREALLDEIPHRHETGLEPVVGHRENRAFRLVQDQVGFLVRFVRVGQDLVGRINQVPQRRLFLDDPRVVLDVGRPRHTVGQRRHVRRPTNLVKIAAARQFLLERDEVDRLVPLVERDHLVEDAAMRITIEIRRVDDLGGVIERVIVHEDGTEHRSLGFEIVRKCAFRSSNNSVGHERMELANGGTGV